MRANDDDDDDGHWQSAAIMMMMEPIRNTNTDTHTQIQESQLKLRATNQALRLEGQVSVQVIVVGKLANKRQESKHLGREKNST